MKDDSKKRALEMTGYGKREKSKAGFPRFPQPLEIAVAIPTFPQPRRLPRGKVEIQKQDSHFPIAASIVLKNLKKEDSPERRVSPSFRLIVRLEYAGGFCARWGQAGPGGDRVRDAKNWRVGSFGNFALSWAGSGSWRPEMDRF